MVTAQLLNGHFAKRIVKLPGLDGVEATTGVTPAALLYGKKGYTYSLEEGCVRHKKETCPRSYPPARTELRDSRTGRGELEVVHKISKDDKVDKSFN